MAKARRNKGNVRHNPYGRGQVDTAMDDAERHEPEKCETTRGHLLQRHKREQKEIRKMFDAKQQSISKLSKKDFKEKKARKDLKKEIEDQRLKMERRQAAELAEFDARANGASSAPMVDEETKRVPFSFSLPATAPGVEETEAGLMEGAPRLSLHRMELA